ncbi:hypothetical protein PspR76_17735 [Pseudomonas sp. R76]|nr:hypothetical protein PspR76_17735 [Pseudomonas sp. R76]
MQGRRYPHSGAALISCLRARLWPQAPSNSTRRRLALRPFAAMFGKAWGYPLLVVESKDQAWALARDVLDEQVSDVAHF